MEFESYVDTIIESSRDIFSLTNVQDSVDSLENCGIVLSKEELTTIYGGASDYYSIQLSHPCRDVVSVRLVLDTPLPRAFHVSTFGLYFNAGNWNVPQTINVEAAQMLVGNAEIRHFMQSADGRFNDKVLPKVELKTTMNSCVQVWITGGTVPGVHAKCPVTPTLVQGLSLRMASISFNIVACGHNFTIVGSTSALKLYAWGSGGKGELGGGGLCSSMVPKSISRSAFRRPTDYPSIKQVSCGKHHVALITSSGRLFTWGCNVYGQTGHRDVNQLVSPKEVFIVDFSKNGNIKTEKKGKHAWERVQGFVLHAPPVNHTVIQQVACGAFHTMVLSKEFQAWAVGYNKAGQLGLGHRKNSAPATAEFQKLEALLSGQILQIAAGLNHSACISGDGKLYMWGCGSDGRLGLGDRENYSSPQLVTSLIENNIRPRMIRCGAQHSCIVTERHQLFVWGSNEFGQLGLNDYTGRLRPCLLRHHELATIGIHDVSLGQFHSACVSLNGDVFTWGYDVDGGLGLDYIGSCVLVPTKVKALAGLGTLQIACGWTHTVVLSKYKTPLYNAPEVPKKVKATPRPRVRKFVPPKFPTKVAGRIKQPVSTRRKRVIHRSQIVRSAAEKIVKLALYIGMRKSKVHILMNFSKSSATHQSAALKESKRRRNSTSHSTGLGNLRKSSKPPHKPSRNRPKTANVRRSKPISCTSKILSINAKSTCNRPASATVRHNTKSSNCKANRTPISPTPPRRPNTARQVRKEKSPMLEVSSKQFAFESLLHRPTFSPKFTPCLNRRAKLKTKTKTSNI